MTKGELTQEEIIEVFETLEISKYKKYLDNTFEVWEVPPIRKGMQIYFESH